MDPPRTAGEPAAGETSGSGPDQEVGGEPPTGSATTTVFPRHGTLGGSALLDEAQQLTTLEGAELEAYLDCHPDLERPRVVASFCRRAAGLLRMDLPLAHRMVEAATAVAERLDDPASSGRAARASAQIHHLEGSYRDALAGYERAVEGFAAGGEELQAAITRSCALHVLALLGRFEKAERWAEEARRVYTGLGDRVRLARLEVNVAVILHRRHRFEEALQHNLRAFERLRAQGTPQDLAVTLRNLLVCYISMRNLPLALEVYERARAFAERHHFPRLVMEADYNIAHVHLLRGEHERAIHLYERSRVRFRELGDPLHEALCDLDQSEVHLDLREIDDVERLATAAAESFRRLGVGQEAGRALIHLAVVHGSRGDSVRSLELLSEARELFDQHGDGSSAALTDFYRALVLEQAGQRSRALEVARSAEASSGDEPRPGRRALFQVLLVLLQLDDGAGTARHHCARALEELAAVAGGPRIPSPGWLLPPDRSAGGAVGS